MAVSTTGKYEVHNQPVEVVLAWLKGGEIAIPEIQRPFVWGCGQCPQSQGFAVPGLSHRIPHRLAEREGSTEGWPRVSRQKDTD